MNIKELDWKFIGNTVGLAMMVIAGFAAFHLLADVLS